MPIVKRTTSTKIPYRLITVAILFLLVIAGSLMFFAAVVANEKIYGGVSVCGINVGGMTRDEAYIEISEKVKSALGDEKIDVFHQDRRRTLDFSEKVSFDSLAVVDIAYNVGRRGDFLKRIPFIFGGKVDIPHILNFDDEYIKSKISSFAQEIEIGTSSFEFSKDMTKVTIDLSGKGIIINVDATFDKFTENASNMIFEDISLVIQTEFDEKSAELLYQRISRDPVNADCQIINNRPVIHEHKVGVVVDKVKIAENIAQGKKVFDVGITTVMPEITTEKLRSSMFADVLGEYSTAYSNSNQGRTTNITIAAEKINGVVIAKGENFSFNRIVGERTYERGYRDANVYVGGRLEQGVGGGICQVVSTLYTAQLYSDLQTVSRQNHQFTVSYLPLGLDATIAWGFIDYEFKNNTEYPIKIVSSVNNGKVTVKILGTKDDKNKTVKVETKIISSNSPSEIVKYSTDLEYGKNVVTQNGQNGAIVDTYKVYLRNGVEQERVLLHRSTYSAMDRIITKSSKQAPPPTPSPSAAPVETNGGNITETPNESTTPSPSSSPPPTPIQDDYISDNGL